MRRQNGTGHLRSDGYIIIRKKGKSYLEHRYIWQQTFGEIPPGFHIHHKNKIKSDNRLENLEILNAKEHNRLHFAGREGHKHTLETRKKMSVSAKARKGKNPSQLLGKICKVEGCDSFIKNLKAYLCNKHYIRFLKFNDVHKFTPPHRCLITGRLLSPNFS